MSLVLARYPWLWDIFYIAEWSFSSVLSLGVFVINKIKILFHVYDHHGLYTSVVYIKDTESV